MSDKRRRSWFRFSLRALLLVVLVVALGIWVAQSRHWIKQRHDALWPESCDGFCYTLRPVGTVAAPGPLWLFGEAGVSELWVRDGRIDDAHQLYPESKYHDARGLGGTPLSYEQFKAHLAEIGEQ